MSGDDLQPFRIDSLAMAGLGGSMAPAPAPQAAAGAAPGDVGYPTLESICSKKKSFEAFSAQVEATMAKLEADGSAEAKKAIVAYEHMSGLVQQLIERTIAELKRLRAGG